MGKRGRAMGWKKGMVKGGGKGGRVMGMSGENR